MKIKSEIHPLYRDNTVVTTFCQHLSQSFDEIGEVIFKKRNTVRQIELSINGQPTTLIVKRFRKPNIIQKITYLFGKKTKGYKAYYNAIVIHERGFDTPLGVGYVEVWSGLFLQSAYYISLANFEPAIGTELTEQPDFNREIAKYFGQYVAQLHLQGILHHDLNSSNVLFSLEENDCHFTLIDINRMTFYRVGQKIPLSICYDNMTRFCGNPPLFECVMQAYISYRQLDNTEDELQKAIAIKVKHDTDWDKKKNFFKKFKPKKKSK